MAPSISTITSASPVACAHMISGPRCHDLHHPWFDLCGYLARDRRRGSARFSGRRSDGRSRAKRSLAREASRQRFREMKATENEGNTSDFGLPEMLRQACTAGLKRQRCGNSPALTGDNGPERREAGRCESQPAAMPQVCFEPGALPHLFGCTCDAYPIKCQLLR
jgi:hypothetical protein